MAPKGKPEAAAPSIFLKRNWQVVYAVILIILVPVSIVANTFFVVERFRKTVDVELQRTALLIGKMINVTSLDQLGDPVKMQERITQVASVISEVKSMDLLAKEGDDFKVVASLYTDGIGRPAHGRQYILAWYDSQSIAYLTKSGRSAAVDQMLTADEARSSERFWGVVVPLKDAQGNTALLLTAKISLNVIDQLVRDNLFWSYIWLSVTVLIVVLLLAANTRLFEYALLFKKLKEVDQMKDDFIAMASHELRAPITAIRGYLSLFLEDAFGKMEEKPKGILKTTFAIATHLGGLVEDLLEVSRIEQGRMSMTFEAVQPEEVIEEIRAQLAFEAERKLLAFEFKKPAEPLPKILVDRGRFKQVLINFMSNAIKYTPKGGVTVTSEVKDGNMIEVKVIDTGLGMSAEAREKLFTKFYRIKTDDTRAIPGTGLGLWITKQIVEGMKGRIFVDSIEKVGTQISAVFPVAPPSAEAMGGEPASAKKKADPKPDASKPSAPGVAEKKTS